MPRPIMPLSSTSHLNSTNSKGHWSHILTLVLTLQPFLLHLGSGDFLYLCPSPGNERITMITWMSNGYLPPGSPGILDILIGSDTILTRQV